MNYLRKTLNKAKNYIDFIKYLIFVTIVLSVAYIFSYIYKSSNLLISLIVVFLFSTFIALPVLYNATVKKIHKLLLLKKSNKEGGLIYKFLKGRTFIFIFSVAYSVISSLFMINQFVFMSLKDWIFLFISAVIFYITFHSIKNYIRNEVKDFYDTVLSLKISIFTAAFFSSIFYVIFAFITKVNSWSTIDKLIYFYNQKIPLETSFLKGLLYNYTICSNVAKDTFLAFTQNQNTALYLLLFIFFLFMYFVNMNIIFSVYFIGLKELRRVFADLEETDEPPPIKIETSIMVGFISSLVFIILIFLFLELENYFRSSWNNIVKDSKYLCIRTVEKIDGIIVKAGTSEKIRRELENQSITCKIAKKYKKELFSAVEKSFSKVERNVDLFLDNFYSLKGEYARLLALGLGNLEEHMQKEMQNTLFKDNPFKDLEDVFEKITNDEKLKNDIYISLVEKIEKIKTENKISKEFANGLLIQEKNINNQYLKLYVNKVTEDFKKRILEAMSIGGSGVVAAFFARPLVKKMAKNITLKISKKLVIKTATKSIGKVIQKGILGTVVGGISGSIIPGIGNVIGAGIGFIIGISVGIAADEIMLKIDESFTREEFKRNILKILEEEKENLKRKIHLSLDYC